MEAEYDIIIIGAGVLGAASAFHLIRNHPSKKILIVERFPGPANGNTGRSNAMFRNTFTSRDNQTLSDSSIDYYLDLQKSGTDIGMRKTGYLWLLSGKQLSRNERFISEMKDARIEIDTYERNQLQQALPTLHMDVQNSDEAKLLQLEDIESGVFGGKCGRLDPVKITEHYLLLFENLGGKIAYNTLVERLLVEPNNQLGIEGEPFVWQDSKIVGVSVRGAVNGNIRSENLVIASGAWNNELLERVGIDGHVKAKKRQMFVIQAGTNPELLHLIRNDSFNDIHTLPFVILPKAGCFLKAIPEKKEFWVACDDDFNREYINIPSHQLDEYRAELQYYVYSVSPILREYFGEFKGENPSSMWAGLYSYNTLDYLPYVFAERGAIVVGGDSGSGIMKGDSLGRIVSAVYSGASDAELYNGNYYECEKIGFAHRSVDREEWVI